MVNTSKTVLVVLPLEPYPEGSGSMKRAAAHLCALIETSRVHLVVFDSHETAENPVDKHLYASCESVSVVRYRWRPRRAISHLPPSHILAELFNPTLKRRLPSPSQIQQGFTHAKDQKYDAVLCFKLTSATIFDYARRFVNLSVAKRIVDFDDIQSIANQRAKVYTQKPGVQQSVIDGFIRRQIRRAEDCCLASYDAVWVCSETDREKLLSQKPHAETHSIPNSVGLAETSPVPGDRHDVHLLFVGTFGYGPNLDGVMWFCSEILPLIKLLSSQNVRLTIVGYNPTAQLKSLEKRDQITVTGG